MVGRVWRRLALISIDVIAAIAAVLLAFFVRFEGVIPGEVWMYIRVLPVIVPARVVIYYYFGLYSQIWSHASIPELLRIVWAVTVDTALSTGIIFILPHDGFPRSVLIIGWVLKIGALGSVRLLLRLRHEWHKAQRAPREEGKRTLIFGAGDAGVMLAREFAKHPELGSTVVGFIDDDPLKQGYHIAGKQVLGTRADLPTVVHRHKITHLVIAVPSAHSLVIREVVETGRQLGLNLKTLPGLYELVSGQGYLSQIRDIQIEDLLGREEIRVDLDAIAGYLGDQSVLITGAGGSIGSELCRQVARFSPRQLVLVGHGENSIYDIHQELTQAYPHLDLHPVIADIQDESRIRRVFERFRPGVVFHAAAHKHVPLMEQNAEEAIKNNVFGTLHVARAADFYRAKRFVLISSDKAVNPSSVMGATKRAAEYIVRSLAQSSHTVFVGVRFGNVLGSRGSVVPLFQKQIAAGGPVTVTDPKMMRYFMTIPEAVQLVIQAGSMGTGGEIFVLNMGKPVRIVDLARDLIRLSGLKPDVDIPIVYTGIRNGEKLFEELLTAEEGTRATHHQCIFCASGEPIPQQTLQVFLESLQELVSNGLVNNDQIVRGVSEVVGKVTLRTAVGSGP